MKHWKETDSHKQKSWRDVTHNFSSYLKLLIETKQEKATQKKWKNIYINYGKHCSR